MRLLMGLLAGQEGKNFILTGDTFLMRGQWVEEPLSLMGGKIFVREKRNSSNIN